MDYGEANPRCSSGANEKFELPVEWGLDLQSEHERYLTDKYAKSGHRDEPPEGTIKSL